MSSESEKETEPQNHYQVLGLDRSADERAIKKAYFTLIRKFTPDKHPEEFRRIRDSYEVLSDPVTRKRYDGTEENYGEYGPELGQTLREVVAAGRAGDEELVRQKLTAVLEKHPAVHAARHLFGSSHLRAQEFDKALEIYTALTTELPDNLLYALHLGYALTALDRLPEALVAFEKAHALKPADVSATLALADSLAQAKRPAEALQILAQALVHHQELGPARLVLELRRISIMGSAGDHESMQSEAKKLTELAGAAKDPEMSQYLSGELTGVAAKLFAGKHHSAANDLLVLCQKLNPDSTVMHPWKTTTLAVDELPEKTRAWLANLKEGAPRSTLEHSSWWWPLVGSISTAATLALTAFRLWDEPQPTTVERLVWTFIGLALAVLQGMLTVRAVYRLVVGGIRHRSTVTLLHILSVTPGQVRAFPLFALDNVRVVKHTTNGAYTHTVVTIEFAEGPNFSVSIRNEYNATGWANYVLECRHRALELLFEGFLEAEPDADLIPPKLLSGTARKPVLSPAERRWWGGAAGAAVAGLLLTIPINAYKVDESDFGRAAQAGTAEAFSFYLQSHPKSGRAKQIRAIQTERFDADLAAFTTACAAPAPCETLVRALRDLREVPPPQVAISLRTTVDGVGAEAFANGATQSANRAAAELLAVRLTTTLQTAGMANLEVTAAGAAPVSVSLQRRLSVDGTLRPGVPRLLTSWSARLKDAHGETILPILPQRASVVRMRAPKTPAELPDSAISAQLGQDNEALTDALAAALGLKDAALLARQLSPLTAQDSPY